MTQELNELRNAIISTLTIAYWCDGHGKTSDAAKYFANAGRLYAEYVVLGGTDTMETITTEARRQYRETFGH